MPKLSADRPWVVISCWGVGRLGWASSMTRVRTPAVPRGREPPLDGAPQFGGQEVEIGAADLVDLFGQVRADGDLDRRNGRGGEGGLGRAQQQHAQGDDWRGEDGAHDGLPVQASLEM